MVNIDAGASHASDSQTLDDERQQLVKLSVVEKRDDCPSGAQPNADRGCGVDQGPLGGRYNLPLLALRRNPRICFMPRRGIEPLSPSGPGRF